MLQCSLGGEATCEVRIEKGTDEVLGCDVERESQISAFPQATIGPWRTFVGSIPPLPVVEVYLAPVGLKGVYLQRRMKVMTLQQVISIRSHYE